MDSDRKCKFHRFCPARSDCNNIAHAILSCYKLQGAFNQFNEKIWKLQQKYFSYKRDQRRSFASTFICISKFTNLYERILKMQALIGLKDCHKPMGISVAFIHQHLKNNANPRVCSIALLWMIVCIILKLDQDLLLTRDLGHSQERNLANTWIRVVFKMLVDESYRYTHVAIF